MLNVLILLAHPTAGALGILAAVWVFVETLNARETNLTRTRAAAFAVAGLVWAAFVIGGYWYVTAYYADKVRIVTGPWPFAHSFFMETKEHVFLILLLVATFLPIAARANLATSRGARNLVLWSAALVVVLGLAMEGAGALIAMSVKVALLAK